RRAAQTPAMIAPPALERTLVRRRVVRAAAATLALGCAVVYFLIGFGPIYPAGKGDAGFMLAFGLSAGAAFALGALLLAAFDRAWLWLLGAAFQLAVIAAYFQVAPNRTPPYEAWGLGLKAAQAVLLGLLAWLAATGTRLRARSA
ncbi:MAG TPA: hypothetical protein VHN99_01450, partial [Deinococcales bacterium]|nr:hypothetical protein [Deinococcales bacterium]